MKINKKHFIYCYFLFTLFIGCRKTNKTRRSELVGAWNFCNDQIIFFYQIPEKKRLSVCKGPNQGPPEPPQKSRQTTSPREVQGRPLINWRKPLGQGRGIKIAVRRFGKFLILIRKSEKIRKIYNNFELLSRPRDWKTS